MAQRQAATVRGRLPERWHGVELPAACSVAVLRGHGSFVEELGTSSVVQSVKSQVKSHCRRNAFFGFLMRFDFFLI